MNIYIRNQISNMKFTLMTFKKSCELAALQDDQNISHEEAKQLKKLYKAIDKFQRELDSV